MKNISVFKNTDKVEGSQQPDYRVVASWKEGETWKSVTVGSLWRESGDNPNAPVLKGKMSEEYTNSEGKTFPAFEIKRVQSTEPSAVNGEPQPEINPEDIPF